MGYICLRCGEGLPDDTPCPCTIGPDDEDDELWTSICGPLTAEIANPRSPVRQFISERFTAGLRDLQGHYRVGAPSLIVPAVPRAEANPGTVGTAADWLLRFLVQPRPSLELAANGALLCGARRAAPSTGMLAALGDIASSLGLGRSQVVGSDETAFAGPMEGNAAPPELLARACWALALLTEVWRGGPMVAAAGPLGQFRNREPSASKLLALAPPAALGQLAAFREVFQTALLSKLAAWHGPWRLGPTFSGSALLHADADLIAAGLLLDLKTSAKKPSLAVTDLFQVIGYALLDYDDEFGINTVGIFSARYAYLATWDLGALLNELARHQVSLQGTRHEFRDLLIKYSPTS
jgi:hypothetical protein